MTTVLPKPFFIDVSTDALVDLKRRIAATRWPDEVPSSDWAYGTDRTYLKQLADYWHAEFDWPAQQQRLNALPNWQVSIAGCQLHYLHFRSGVPGAIPIVLLHGWPSSYLQMVTLAKLLIQTKGSMTFDVVVPCLPGYGFSAIPAEQGWGCRRMASVLAQLMRDVLGYRQFVIRGGDIGAAVADWMCVDHSDAVLGCHLTGMLEPDHSMPPDNATQAERRFLERSNFLWLTEMSYARQHASRPQTLAYGLNDSPVALAAWIIEKFRLWSDCQGDLERRFTRDELLTNITMYWLTQTINSSIRVYFEWPRETPLPTPITVPTGMLISHRDLFPAPPREWAMRRYHLVHWREVQQGGHFLEWEEPQLVADDIRAFVTKL